MKIFVMADNRFSEDEKYWDFLLEILKIFPEEVAVSLLLFF